MKNLLTSLIIYTLAINTSFASIESDVLKLEKISMGGSVDKAIGKNAQDILFNYFKENLGDDENLLTTKEYEEMEFGDETDQGFTSLESAKKMGNFAVEMLREKLEGLSDKKEIAEVKAQIRSIKSEWTALITSMNEQGVKFGYSGDGPGYCGVSFIRMLIIDEKTGKIYSIYLSENGTC